MYQLRQACVLGWGRRVSGKIRLHCEKLSLFSDNLRSLKTENRFCLNDPLDSSLGVRLTWRGQTKPSRAAFSGKSSEEIGGLEISLDLVRLRNENFCQKAVFLSRRRPILPLVLNNASLI